jgi:vesicle coat complex subunit
MAIVQNKEKYCTLYIQPEDANTPPPNEIQKTLETGKYEDRIKALKQLITNIIHDDSYPRMVMTIFNFILPLQSQSHDLKKVLFFYWEVE